MKNVKFLFLVLFSTLFFGSCVSHKSTGEIGYSDYNRRKTIRNAKLKKKTSGAGILFQLGATGGGAYLGYDKNFVEIENQDGSMTKNKYVSAAVGGLIGLGVSSIGNKLVKGGDPVIIVGADKNKVQKWIKKYNRTYQLIPNSTMGNTFDIIPKNADQSYTIKGIGDTRQFKKLFPNSKHLNNVLKRSYLSVDRTTLAELVNLFPTASPLILTKIKTRYIKESPSLLAYFDANKKYPNIIKNVPVKALDRIQHMEDVKNYIKIYPNLNQELLLGKAQVYATNLQTVLYFNQQFPANPFFEKVISRIIPSSTSEEIKKMLNAFPNCTCKNKLQIAWLAKSDNITEFIQRNKELPVLNMNRTFDLTNRASTKQLVNQLSENKTILGESITDRLTKEAKEYFLKKNYQSRRTEDKFQNAFITFVKKENWLSPESNIYIKKAKDRIYLNNKAEMDRRNEIDDVKNYVSLVDGYIQTTEGDELSFLQSIGSTLTDMGNMNAFLIGKLKNYGKFPKKVKLKGAINLVKEEDNIYGSSKKSYQKEGDFYTEIPPGGTTDFVILIKYTWKHKDESSIWGRNAYIVNLDKNDPVDIDWEYYNGTISSNIIKKQNQLIRQYQSSGNIAKKSGWQSNYEVTSRGHEIINQSSAAYVDIRRLTENSTSNGCISIFSENDEDYAYISTIMTSKGEIKKFTDANKDNSAGCFSTRDFPLTVSVSYISDNNKKVNTTVKLNDFYDYSISVTE